MGASRVMWPPAMLVEVRVMRCNAELEPDGPAEWDSNVSVPVASFQDAKELQLGQHHSV